MKIKSLFRFLFILMSLIGIVVITIFFVLLPKNRGDKTVNILPEKLFGWKFPVTEFPITGSTSDIAAYSDIRDPGGIPQGLPVRLKIPIIGVDTAIEDALISPDGRMDVPIGSINVAWFSLGPHPGRIGSAVIGGHFGIKDGVKFVFYDLDKLKAGDKIYIEDDKNDTLAFIVRSIKLFDRDADATTVFTSNDGIAHLNLITCEGLWNQVNDTYPDRRVVFTDAIPSEGAVVVKPLQTAKTIFPSTDSTISPQPDLGSKLPPTEDLKSTAPNVINLLTSPQMFIASAQKLYATPLDGLITSLFLISILFVALKIIRR